MENSKFKIIQWKTEGKAEIKYWNGRSKSSQVNTYIKGSELLM